mgnify:CR=1 FL=1|tara:strand:+ start:125 stop:1234 length:1110 start_codon:yes stop_codon:yes gene_type:complete
MKIIGPKAYIHTDRLKKNLWNIRRHVGDRKLICVVKANGYGHGSLNIVNSIKDEPGISFAVFSFEEAFALRKEKIQNDILIFSRIQDNHFQKAIDLDLIITVSTVDDQKRVIEFYRENNTYPRFHLNFDTGMTRLGMALEDGNQIFNLINRENEFMPEGIYSHFATADEGDLSFAEIQLNRFKQVVQQGLDLGINFKSIHFSNSGTILNIPDALFNAVRVGILMYGVAPSDEVPMDIDVEPVMSFCAPIVYVRFVKAGTPISYGGIYITENNTNIGVVQCGFADGFPRPWFEKGYVSYNGKNYKIAGRACMDQLMVDFGDTIPKEGDEVLFFGKKDGNDIRVETIAQAIDTTTYVLLTDIHGRTERIKI